jgi:hypothetical protein
MKRSFAVTKILPAMIAMSCAEPRAPAPSQESNIDESNACERFCERLTACNIAPNSCRPGCEQDQKKLREGFYPSLAGCLEQELSDAACSQKSLGERRQSVSLCFAATVKVWSEKDDGTSLRTIVESVCARQARCAKGGETSQECAKRLEGKLKPRVTGTLFSVARPELVTKVSTCVTTASCDDDDAVDRCFDTALK